MPTQFKVLMVKLKTKPIWLIEVCGKICLRYLKVKGNTGKKAWFFSCVYPTSEIYLKCSASKDCSNSNAEGSDPSGSDFLLKKRWKNGMSKKVIASLKVMKASARYADF